MSNVYDPVNTYRIQFNKEFTFSDLEKIIPYLKKLGIRTVYASPVFHAPAGSMHGYDGINPNEINPEIGTEQQLLAISKILKEQNIEWLQDIVPNHLSFHEENKWLMDVLHKGPSSSYAEYFDIDWDHPKYGKKLIVPFPGSPLEEKLKTEFPDAEFYYLCSWKETDQSINYRRFFTVNSLICVNIQNSRVFDEYHHLIKKLTGRQVFSGLRVDHIDGLYDPKKYLRQLRELGGEKTYIVVEKILEPNEKLATDWLVQGSSGYDYLGMINNLFTNQKSESALTAFYNKLTGDYTPVGEQIKQKKSFILFNQMGGELANLCRMYRRLGLAGDLSDEEIKKLVSEYLISCPVYRYYGDDIPKMDRDQNKNEENVKIFYRRAMQFTGPLMAKGVEDTLMYTYNRFIGHNEVGDSPAVFGYTNDEFHSLMEDRIINWPLAMNASSTHDTKRGEDARARLNVLSDVYEEWIMLVEKWQKENGSIKKNNYPDPNDEYFIYQTIIATYPTNQSEIESYPTRICEYLQKALRESKRKSSWSDANEEYEEAAKNFAVSLIDPKNNFWKSFTPFFEKIKDFGMINSFGQLILKFTCPGVPDIYQGTEFWDLSMVDPDNRRPVDYVIREKFLNSDKSLAELWLTRDNAQIKISLLQKLISIRNQNEKLFAEGKYTRVNIEGKFATNAIAFVREFNNTKILSVIALHLVELTNGTLDDITLMDWQDTKIILPTADNNDWEDLLNGGNIKANAVIFLKEICRQFPSAILISK